MRRRRWVTPEGRATILFGVLFAAVVTAGALAMRPGSVLDGARRVTPAVRLPDPSWFCVFYRGGIQLDLTYVWNDLSSAIAGARDADVVFLGSSRMQFALPPHELQAFEKRSRVRAFSLALPFNPSAFAVAILEKFDLHPRVAVAEVDGFFIDRDPIEAGKIVREGWWGGLRTVWEEQLAMAIWPVASRMLPSFAVRRTARHLLRSRHSGAWLPVDWPHRHAAATRPAFRMPHPRVLAHARRVRDALARRGTELVLTCVPSSGEGCAPDHAKALAAAIGVRAVAPSVDRLWTSDYIHLCPLSGKRFGRELLREVGKLDAVRAARR